MSKVSEAVFKAFKPDKLNYELPGNGDSHMHWHIFPRRMTELNPINLLPSEKNHFHVSQNVFVPTPKSSNSSVCCLSSGRAKTIANYGLTGKRGAFCVSFAVISSILKGDESDNVNESMYNRLHKVNELIIIRLQKGEN
jgi:hypothetical protein